MDSPETGRGSHGTHRAHFWGTPLEPSEVVFWGREYEVYAGGSLGDSKAANA